MDVEKARAINEVLDAAAYAAIADGEYGHKISPLTRSYDAWVAAGRPLVEPSDTAALGVLRAKIQRDLDRMGMGDGAKTYAGIVLAKIDRLAGKVKVVEIEGDGWKSVWWSAGDGLKRELGVKPGSRAYIVMEEPP